MDKKEIKEIYNTTELELRDQVAHIIQINKKEFK